jgi:23S rRNA G2069 N7-methylase RlmK/C1962 C5-methylase RlmI
VTEHTHLQPAAPQYQLRSVIAAANDGFRKSKRNAKIIRTFGAGYDHPIHPALKESEYLKSITFLVE